MRPIPQKGLRKRHASSPLGVLMVGNFLSESKPGFSFNHEALAKHLSSNGQSVLITSNKAARLNRLADMLLTIWRRRKDYSIAHVAVFSGPAFVWAESVCWLLKRLRKPLILTLHGGNLPNFAKRWPRRVRRLLNSANAVTTPSRYLQDALRPYRSDLVLLPNAIDLKLYPFRLRSKPQPKLVWLRAFHEIYNPIMAPRALAHLLESALAGQAISAFSFQLSDFHLAMFGPDKGDGSLQRVKAEIRKLKLEDSVSLPGAVAKSEVPGALNERDIFLNTTNIDNTPVSVIEAMACGLCVVTTDVGGIPFLVKNEVDGLTVPAGDEVAMANAVKRILEEPGLAARLSRNARAKAERFDWAVVLPQWEKLLLEIAVAAHEQRNQRTAGQPLTDN